MITLDTATDKLTDTTYRGTGGSPPELDLRDHGVEPTTLLLDNAQRRRRDAASSATTPTGSPGTRPATPTVDAAGNPYMMLLDGTATLPDGLEDRSGAAVPAGTIPANSPTRRCRDAAERRRRARSPRR